MADINCNGEMTKYHDEKVTLSSKQQGDMRKRRNAGRTRLQNGLETNGYPQPKEVVSQGSYRMRTMIQDSANEYDIDDGVYFAEDDLKDDDENPLSPLAARERVCDALKWDGRLKQEAIVKPNCVRQEYPEGYHIDMPVYKSVVTTNDDGEKNKHFELASGDSWVISDARAVSRWYNDEVGEINEGEHDGNQMRRITRLTKRQARSREQWKKKTTSGICISKLVVDHFVPVADRDDLSLRKTWKAIEKQLRKSTAIDHPVLTKRLAEDGDSQVTFFRDHLTEALMTLDKLDADDCTRTKAREVWDEVFDTTFFGNQPDDNDGSKKSESAAPLFVTSNQPARRDANGGRFG